MLNSSMSLVPVDALLKIYLKVPFFSLYYSCFTLITWLFCLTMMQLLPSLLMTSLSSLHLGKKEDAEAAAQSLVNSVVIWIQEWKLNLNTDKSEVCPLSTWSKTALGILLSSLTLRKFASTLLLVSSV